MSWCHRAVEKAMRFAVGTWPHCNREHLLNSYGAFAGQAPLRPTRGRVTGRRRAEDLIADRAVKETER